MICIPAGQASVIYREIPKMAPVGQNRALSMKKYTMMAASPLLHSDQLAVLHPASVPLSLIPGECSFLKEVLQENGQIVFSAHIHCSCAALPSILLEINFEKFILSIVVVIYSMREMIFSLHYFTFLLVCWSLVLYSSSLGNTISDKPLIAAGT